jgi:predicted amidophosphoribosyltransferase
MLSHHLYIADYNSIFKKFIHHGKYKFNKDVWTLIGELLKERIIIKDKSVITFVPLHWLRYCYRGFNQSKIIANKLGRTKKILKRIKNTSSFTSLDREERLNEAMSLFKLIDVNLKGTSTCYIVDDIVTSGATIETCARLIKEKHPHVEVIGISFAKTPKHSKFMVN